MVENQSIDWEEYKKVLLTSSNTYEKVSEFLVPYYPKKLYKYGSFKSEFWENTIFKGQIYLATASSFNDPFDCLIHLDANKLFGSDKFKKILLSHKPFLSESDFSKNNCKQLKLDVVNGLRDDLRVTCFSELWNSILMWSHYADCHQGFCVEYDVCHFSEFKRSKLFPVLYQKDQIDITNDIISNSPNTGLASMVGKAQEWSYEKEWRMISVKGNFPTSFYFRREIKSVFLGLNCEEEKRARVYAWAKENGKKVFQTKISSGKYEIIKERLI